MSRHEEQELEQRLRIFYQAEVPQEPGREWVKGVLADRGRQRPKLWMFPVPRMALAAAVMLLLVIGTTSLVVQPWQVASPSAAWPEPSHFFRFQQGGPFVQVTPETPGTVLPALEVEFNVAMITYAPGEAIRATFTVHNRGAEAFEVRGQRLVIGPVGANMGSVAIEADDLGMRPMPGGRMEEEFVVPDSMTVDIEPGQHTLWLITTLTNASGDRFELAIRSDDFAVIDRNGEETSLKSEL